MLSTPNDHALLISSLLHAEACLNIVSTISLDAAILDRPVIGIEFRRELNAPSEIMYEEYETDHYRPLVDSGGVRLAHKWTELITLMHDALNEPERDRRQRAQMVERECGQVDGHAKDRVVTTLLDLLRAPVWSDRPVSSPKSECSSLIAQ
jgi:CDP-glycerol glycerophosphotransferase (TagB/SpsB family)